MTELIKALDVHGRGGIREGEMIISSSLRNRRKRRAPGAPVTSLLVTGTLNPDVTGEYIFAGHYQDKPYYKHRTLNWWIWYYFKVPPAVHSWNITKAVGSTPDNYWNKDTETYQEPVSDYTPQGGATGTATVSLPPG